VRLGRSTEIDSVIANLGALAACAQRGPLGAEIACVVGDVVGDVWAKQFARWSARGGSGLGLSRPAPGIAPRSTKVGSRVGLRLMEVRACVLARIIHESLIPPSPAPSPIEGEGHTS